MLTNQQLEYQLQDETLEPITFPDNGMSFLHYLIDRVKNNDRLIDASQSDEWMRKFIQEEIRHYYEMMLLD